MQKFRIIPFQFWTIYTILALWVFPHNFISADDAPEEEKEAQDVFIYNDHGRRDPFWPLVNSNGTLVTYDADLAYTDFDLEGIMSLGEDERVAMINGKIIKQNDVIGDYLVVEIKENTVVLSKGPQRFELILKKEAGNE